MAKNASVPMEIEPRRAFYTAKGNNLRPDFMSITSFNGPLRSAYDVSVTHTSLSYPSNPHHAAEQRYSEKNKKYKEECTNRSTTFIPLVFETCGYWRPEVQNYIKLCAEKASDRLHVPISTLIHRFTTQLSSILHRETAELLINFPNIRHKYSTDTSVDQLALDMANQDMFA
jgi:hypothetical protein